MAARQWTPEQRAKQAELIRKWRPWELSSGAKTLEGKAVSSRNAYRGGLRVVLREISALLREQQECHDSVYDRF
jgi:hypothetical protein